VHPARIRQQVVQVVGRQRHAVTPHRALPVHIEQRDDASGARGRQRRQVDGFARERLTQHPCDEVVGHGRHQPNGGTAARQAHGHVGTLSAGAHADARRSVASGPHRRQRSDHDVQQAVAEHGDQHGRRLV
jgi:hypothetical protein